LKFRTVFVALCIALLTASFVTAQDNPSVLTYSGSLNRRHPSDRYTFDMTAGQSVLITGNATSDSLDPSLQLTDPKGNLVAQNDDRNPDSVNAALGYTADTGGTYTITISRYRGDANSGSYELTITVGDASVLAPLSDLTTFGLSGSVKQIETKHFRIHYTLSGVDATTDAFASDVADTMETVRLVEIDQLGWPAPILDPSQGKDARVDVFLTDLLDDDGTGTLGITTPGGVYGDNPNTPEHEKYGSFSTIRLDNDFAEGADRYKIVPHTLMQAVAAHEFHHVIEGSYDALEEFTWYFEATATWMETLVFPKNPDPARFVEYNYKYPELCFGTENDPNGSLMYGDWMFIQSLADQYGSKVIQKLWTNIAQYDGWAALEHTLADYGETIPQAIARYRVQNLVRDYKFGTYFGNAKVFLENNIRDTGRWTFTGNGIEELGANYYNFLLPAGSYKITLTDDQNRLDLWAVGVSGKKADAYHIGREGNISTTDYEHMYLIVFDPAYHHDVNDCTYVDYAIEVSAAKGASVQLDHTWNARYFSPPTR
jgi:hypothetical protein